jgi:hypothetical protein
MLIHISNVTFSWNTIHHTLFLRSFLFSETILFPNLNDTSIHWQRLVIWPPKLFPSVFSAFYRLCFIDSLAVSYRWPESSILAWGMEVESTCLPSLAEWKMQCTDRSHIGGVTQPLVWIPSHFTMWKTAALKPTWISEKKHPLVL